jgi:hypothetical protein
MSKYALIAGDRVTNIIVADSLEIANEFGTAVECTNNLDAEINGYYKKETNEFSKTPFEVIE